MQQAPRYPRREGVPPAGQHRQTCEQGVARRGMGVVRGGVEEEPRQLVAGQVILKARHPGGEDDARRVHTAGCGLPEQVRLGGAVQLHEPQDAPRHPPQQTHPDVEDRRIYLVIVIEGTEDEPFRRQAVLLPRRHALRELQGPVRRQVGVGEIDHLFPEVDPVLLRYYLPVGQDVVHVLHPHGAGVA